MRISPVAATIIHTVVIDSIKDSTGMTIDETTVVIKEGRNVNDTTILPLRRMERGQNKCDTVDGCTSGVGPRKKS